jgi:predicted metal-dependent HD superfamily phosphohydrolase
MIDQESLKNRFSQLWRRLGLAGGDPAFAALAEAYGEKHRAYHDLAHISRCLDHLDSVPGLNPDLKSEAELALWYHDVIYAPLGSDNEEKSAEFLIGAAKSAGLPDTIAQRAAAAIRATAAHESGSNPLADLVCDCDMAVLGASKAEYDLYEANIRREYRLVPASLFRKGRARILADFFGRERIYATDFFHARFDARARSNIARALKALE